MKIFIHHKWHKEQITNKNNNSKTTWKEYRC